MKLFAHWHHKIHPEYPECKPCNCIVCRKTSSHDGVFLVRKQDVNHYLKTFSPVQLRLQKNSKGVNKLFKAMNFGISKGLTFDRVLIFPTKDMESWLINRSIILKKKTKAHLYVSLTRAKFSVAIVYDFDKNTDIQGVQKYNP